MPVAMGIVGAVGAIGNVVGGIMGADANAKIADAKAKQAAADRTQAMQLAAPTAQEIQGIADRIQSQQRYQAVQEAGLERDQKILSTLDPALITAGKQANNLMNGQQAAILAPMKQQQDFQRNQLKQKLAAQLGPGFETSSAGQAALQSFDMQASMQTQQAQMSALNQVSQFLGFNTGARTAMIGEERQGFRTGADMSAQTLGIQSNIQERQIHALTATSQAMQESAGSEHAGYAGAAKVVSGIGSSLNQIGSSVGGMMSGMNPAPMLSGNTAVADKNPFISGEGSMANTGQGYGSFSGAA